jgi:hypothetical protein
MLRRTTLFVLLAAAIISSAGANVRFSIRYQDKNIYYPGDVIRLKLTLANPVDSGDSELTFHLADDPLESFGFDIRSLTGEPVPTAEGFASSLNDRGAYRVVHLAPGQELSITVTLNQWADLSDPGQYRLTGFFFPERRDRNSSVSQADSVLDLTVMPLDNSRWEDALDEEVRKALIRRDLDPWGVVRETLESRRDSRFNRAVVYLDTESLSQVDRTYTSSREMERALLEGSWDGIPGFEHPIEDWEIISSQVFPSEAIVRLKASYNPFGERFDQDLRFYLHKKSGYWSIRRVEALFQDDADPLRYGSTDLEPQEVVAEMLKAVTRGDWDIVLRYYDSTDLVRNLPEYVDRWKDMSAGEHKRAIDAYRNDLISGRLEDGKKPLGAIDDWTISRVNYTQSEGSVTVENMTTYETANGPMDQMTIYTFRLARAGDNQDRWHVVRYDTLVRR